MPEAVRCPGCGSGLPADAPEGLCPECLLNQAMRGESGSGDGTSTTAPQSHGPAFVPPRPEDLAPFFPQLEILELLGHGGMGIVYKARQLRLDRLVALKILPPELGRDPTFAERFAREARALARLTHPRIVGVHDFGEAGGLFYLLMEYVDGANLRGLLRRGRLEPEEALRIVPQICEALQYAHEEGVVHRDIKPENILLDRRGNAKIADFGLAKLLGTLSADSILTGSRQVIGTLRYMAPEQMDTPLEVDHRADIYSLGVVFYEMLTGELPMGRFAPPSKKAEVDVRLDEVVLRALEKEPERRYQHASEVKTAVESLSVPPRPRGTRPAMSPDTPGGHPAASWRPARRLIVLLDVVSLVAVGGICWLISQVMVGTALAVGFGLAVLWLRAWESISPDRAKGHPSGTAEKWQAWPLLVLIGILYLSSFSFPVCHSYGEWTFEGHRDVMKPPAELIARMKPTLLNGYDVFITTFRQGSPMWLANPVLGLGCLALVMRRWRWAAFAGLIAMALSDPSALTGNPSSAYLAEQGETEIYKTENRLEQNIIIRKQPVNPIHFLAGYWVWKASLVLLAGGGLYGWWRYRRESEARNIRTIAPELDHPKPEPARDLDGS